MHLPSITAALALIGLTAATPVNLDARTLSKDKGLAQFWTSKGRQYIGTALTIRDDPVEQGIIKSPTDFNSITPENAMKWESTEPSRNNFTFAGADAIIDFADKYKKEVRCHTLVWHSQLPAWVSEGNFDNKTLISIMENHIKNVAGRYKNKCTHWDVVNEALEEDGTYRNSVFYKTVGEAFIPISFRLAAKYAGSKTKLYYNDYNLEYGSAKALGAQRILKLIQSYGVQIDGVGLQAHLTSESTASSGGGVTPDTDTLTRVLRLYADLGVEVAYTELDIRFTTPVTKEKLKAQADAYARVTQSCINVKSCVGITIWGVSDKYSWIPGVFKTEGAALLWDEQFNKKPAYDSMLKRIQKFDKS
ncbi:endo-1,4-beta-xylanase [Aureobasidium subglaciale]|nr:endo-1,4-beta-xylanase [Aureobasidium subglaciale]